MVVLHVLPQLTMVQKGLHEKPLGHAVTVVPGQHGAVPVRRQMDAPGLAGVARHVVDPVKFLEGGLKSRRPFGNIFGQVAVVGSEPGLRTGKHLPVNDSRLAIGDLQSKFRGKASGSVNRNNFGLAFFSFLLLLLPLGRFLERNSDE